VINLFEDNSLRRSCVKNQDEKKMVALKSFAIHKKYSV